MIALIFYKDLFDPNITGLDRGSYITIGSFDGVHKGHQQLISTVVREGKKNNCNTVVVTFDPLPKEFFGPQKSSFIRLTSSYTRAERIAWLGVDYILEYTFDQRFSCISAEDFINKILVGLNTKKIYIGKDFRFGYKGIGDCEFLKRKGMEFGFETQVLDLVRAGNERISSTRVRNAMKNGDKKLAIELMGEIHPAWISAYYQNV